MLTSQRPRSKFAVTGEANPNFGFQVLSGVRGTSTIERHIVERGVCASHPNPELWTGDPRRPGGFRGLNEAKRLCREECPVLDLCREWNDLWEQELTCGGRHDAWLSSVYAGQGPKERAERRKAVHAAAA